MSRDVIRTFRDLHAWQAAMELTVFVYGLVKQLPPSERSSKPSSRLLVGSGLLLKQTTAKRRRCSREPGNCSTVSPEAFGGAGSNESVAG
jgi:hypothetical protein